MLSFPLFADWAKQGKKAGINICALTLGLYLTVCKYILSL